MLWLVSCCDYLPMKMMEMPFYCLQIIKFFQGSRASGSPSLAPPPLSGT